MQLLLIRIYSGRNECDNIYRVYRKIIKVLEFAQKKLNNKGAEKDTSISDEEAKAILKRMDERLERVERSIGEESIKGLRRHVFGIAFTVNLFFDVPGVFELFRPVILGAEFVGASFCLMGSMLIMSLVDVRRKRRI